MSSIVFKLRSKYSEVLCAIARMTTNLALVYGQDEALCRERASADNTLSRLQLWTLWGAEGKVVIAIFASVFAALINVSLDGAELDVNRL